jgi:hypothetical protein
VAIFTMTKAGVMFEATYSGAKYTYKPLDGSQVEPDPTEDRADEANTATGGTVGAK